MKSLRKNLLLAALISALLLTCTTTHEQNIPTKQTSTPKKPVEAKYTTTTKNFMTVGNTLDTKIDLTNTSAEFQHLHHRATQQNHWQSACKIANTAQLCENIPMTIGQLKHLIDQKPDSPEKAIEQEKFKENHKKLNALLIQSKSICESYTEESVYDNLWRYSLQSALAGNTDSMLQFATQLQWTNPEDTRLTEKEVQEIMAIIPQSESRHFEQHIFRWKQNVLKWDIYHQYAPTFIRGAASAGNPQALLLMANDWAGIKKYPIASLTSLQINPKDPKMAITYWQATLNRSTPDVAKELAQDIQRTAKEENIPPQELQVLIENGNRLHQSLPKAKYILGTWFFTPLEQMSHLLEDEACQ